MTSIEHLKIRELWDLISDARRAIEEKTLTLLDELVPEYVAGELEPMERPVARKVLVDGALRLEGNYQLYSFAPQLRVVTETGQPVCILPIRESGMHASQIRYLLRDMSLAGRVGGAVAETLSFDLPVQARAV